MAWQVPEAPGEPFMLSDWQAELIDRILERYPDDWHDPLLAGRLRYRQIVISLARQNGKSVIASIMAFYGLLLHGAGATVIGVASSAEQARIIYDRVLFVLNGRPELKRRFGRLTETRGIRSADGTARYEVKASRSASLQGIPVSLGIIDELHITKKELWQAMVNGTAARRNGLVVGVTTAGNDESEMLIDLYKTGKKAAAGDPALERFGFFLWEAPSDEIPTDPETLKEYLRAANPQLAEDPAALADAASDIAGMPPADVIRYRFNRFTASEDHFISPATYMLGAVRDRPTAESAIVFAIDKTPDWSWATIKAAWKVGSKTFAETVLSIPNPDSFQLVDIAEHLQQQHSDSLIVLDGYGFRSVAAEMEGRGMNFKMLNLSDIVAASSMYYAKIIQQQLIHLGEPLMAHQLAFTTRKDVRNAEGFRIARKPGSAIDAVMAEAIAVYAAETHQPPKLQIFI